MDAAGVGKIITISQAVFEGMTNRTTEECLKKSQTGPWPGGCKCNTDSDCIIGIALKFVVLFIVNRSVSHDLSQYDLFTESLNGTRRIHIVQNILLINAIS